jgi:hypothetical protein
MNWVVLGLVVINLWLTLSNGSRLIDIERRLDERDNS